MQTSNNRNFLIVILVLILLGGIAYFVRPKTVPNPEGVFCAQDAKLCPNGSYVGRIPPKCDFAPCGGVDTSSWKNTADPGAKISFKYPEKFSTKYLTPQDWPPKVAIENSPFSCTEAGSKIAPAGQTEKITVNDHTYCKTTETQGAAGTIYSQYAYAFPADPAAIPTKSGKVIIFTFSVRYPQCVNYEDPQKTECEQERQAFNIDSIVDGIVQTIKPDSGSSLNTSEGGIIGTVLLGPTCPGPVKAGSPDPKCADKPYATDLAITTPDDGEVIKKIRSGTDGKFTVSVPPGDYFIRSASSGAILPRCVINELVTVFPGEYASTTVFCDTGMR